MFCDKQCFVKKLRLSPRKNFTESDLLTIGFFLGFQYKYQTKNLSQFQTKLKGMFYLLNHTELKTASKVVRF